MLLDKVIEPDSLCRTDKGVTLGLRLPWYRALPVSTIDVDRLVVDGEVVAPERLGLTINGRTWRMDEMRRATDENWFVTDTATLSVDGLSLEPGSSHDIEVTVSLYPPYIRNLRRAVRWSRKMEVT